MRKDNRIILLAKAEIDELYNIPNFTEKNRKIFFSLSAEEHQLLSKYRTLKLKIYFILQLGYFRAVQQFFNFNFEDIKKDVTYLINRYFSQPKTKLSNRPHRINIKTQQHVILELYNYRNWSNDLIEKTESHLLMLIRYYPQIDNSLRELFKYFENERIVLPKYRTLQDMFSRVLSKEEKRLETILLTIPENIKNEIHYIIKSDNINSNIIRSDQKNFQYSSLHLELKKLKAIAPLYQFCKTFIPKLEISNNGIRYYGELAENYYSSRLKKMIETRQLLYLICFIYSRYQQLIDNLIITFQHHIQSILNDATQHADTMYMRYNANLVLEFPKLVKFLKWFPSKENNDVQLTHLELIKEAYNILPKEQFKLLANFLEKKTFDKKAAKWEFYKKSSGIFSRYLRPVMLVVDFKLSGKDTKLLLLIEYLKNHYSKGKYPGALKIKTSNEITNTIPKKLIPYLACKEDKEYLDPYLFEFYVYLRMHYYINRGKLICNDSISYKDLNHDLIPEETVDKVDEISLKFGYNKIPIYCDKHLDKALKNLDNAWSKTNQNIINGTNKDIALIADKDDNISWKLVYNSKEELDDSFFSNLPKIEIAELIHFIGNKINLWEGFTHIKHRYVKQKKPEKLAMIAGILSEAFGFSVGEMSEICDINLHTLRSNREDFIRLETFSSANDIICNYIYELEIFKAWNLLDGELLADADGKKHQTSNSTIQSRYSKKYFGRGKGISIYSLVANHVVVNAKNIGLNEYEGHNLYDIIYDNKSNITIDHVTGDNHSNNPINFVILDSIDVGYLPSIKNIKQESEKLYSLQNISEYKELLLQPKAKIDTELIKSNKKWIQRVLLSLIMQESTQSTIIRKLSTQDRYSELNAALLEYNKIFKTIHVLNLIDNINLRKAIRAARNRTEAYHQLQGSIRKVHDGVFKGKRIIDNRVSADAVRLVSNCIIAYNSMMLNDLYKKMLKEKAKKYIIDEFLRYSPLSWGHLTFTGRYTFKNSKAKIELQNQIDSLEKKLRNDLWKK